MAVITGTQGNDTLEGGESDDVFIASAGDDLFLGHGGLDVVEYPSHSSLFNMTRDETGIEVYDLIGPRFGDDRLEGIERIRFAEVSLAFDFDGAAGHVARLAGAVFGAAALNETYCGIGLKLLDGGMAVEVLAQLALEVRMGGPASNEAVVSLLYGNVTGFAPSPGEAAPFVQLLDAGMSQAQLALFAAQTTYNLANIGFAGLRDSGLRYFE